MSDLAKKTIVAIATPSGVGSIAIVRVSGECALKIALKIANQKSLKPRYASLLNLYTSDNTIIDEAIVIYFKAPNSFTTEDVVEFQIHGGYIVAKLLLEEIVKCGARLANPGEFTKRAYLGGRVDLTQAEAISKLIESRSIEAHRILTKQLKGALGVYLDSAKDGLIGLLASIEVEIDYAYEGFENRAHIESELKKRVEQFRRVLAGSKRKEGAIKGYKLAIVGKPNVGKSSLLNALLLDDRAIVSDIEGTTRDTIEESINVGTHIVHIIDTAGIRDTQNIIEQKGIERSKKALLESELVLALFDGSRPFCTEDSAILDIIKEHRDSKNILVLVNKKDLKLVMNLSYFSDFEMLHISTKDSIDEIINWIEKSLDDESPLEDELILTTQRQIDILKRCVVVLEDSLELLDEVELLSYNIQEAIRSLNSITKEYDNEEMLDKMFASFCLGK